MSTLVLNVKREYFEQIKSGEKTEEYRLKTTYWDCRLERKWFSRVEIRCGYPKRGDASKILRFVWSGYKVKRILHPHFGKRAVQVFAISLDGQRLDLEAA
jgi:hypothetical protein